jgi:tellurite resistance protein
VPGRSANSGRADETRKPPLRPSTCPPSAAASSAPSRAAPSNIRRSAQYPEIGLLFFGAGFLSLVVLESVVLHRLLTHALPVGLRATTGLHLATPAVGCVAYLAVTDGPPDRFVQMLFGYALLQALVILHLVPWLREQTFSPAAWAYTFGVSALPLAALRFVERGQAGPMDGLALPLFISANLIIGWIAVRTVALAFTGQLVGSRPSRTSGFP